MEENERTMIGSGDKNPAAGMQLPATLRISLAFTLGPLKGKRVRLTKSVVTVGRKSPADIVIPDPTVSGSHARFEIVNKIVTLFDCQSTNGTLVSGQKIKDATLNNMDEVGFGDSRALLTIVDDPYGLYAEDFGGGESEDEQSDTIPLTESYDRCLLGGYGPQQKGIIESVVRNKKLAKDWVSVSNGGEFVQAATIGFKDKRPMNIVITEIRMPLLNGVQAAIAFRHLEKAFGATSPAPVVLFTELGRDANVAKALEYLKPATYLQAVADPVEYQRRAEALVDRLNSFARKQKKQ